MVVPLLSDGRVLALNQYRYLAGRESIEFPCGSVQEGSDYDATARKELLEETGYLADSMTAVGEFNPYNGVTDEMCRIYLARGLRHIGAEPEETEEFEMVPMLPHEFDERIRTGIVWDGMSIAGWHLIRAKGLI
jgi:ADP-ribose pyrophosphatase